AAPFRRRPPRLLVRAEQAFPQPGAELRAGLPAEPAAELGEPGDDGGGRVLPEALAPRPGMRRVRLEPGIVPVRLVAGGATGVPGTGAPARRASPRPSVVHDRSRRPR